MAQGVQVLRRGYHEKVIDHYENPRNVSVGRPIDTGLRGMREWWSDESGGRLY
jgi:NifU-like protein involved in Fe-S cluster formation